MHFGEQRLAFSLDGATLMWVGSDALALLRTGFQPVSAKPFVKFHSVFGEQVAMSAGDGTAVTLTSHECLVAGAALDGQLQVSNSPQLVMAIDPEGEVPYFYVQGDVARELARRYGCLDTSTASDSWFYSAAASSSSACHLGSLPQRAHYPLGSVGRERFREDRAQWYEKRTGKPLEGTVAEQHAIVHTNTRCFRTRNT